MVDDSYRHPQNHLADRRYLNNGIIRQASEVWPHQPCVSRRRHHYRSNELQDKMLVVSFLLALLGEAKIIQRSAYALLECQSRQADNDDSCRFGPSQHPKSHRHRHFRIHYRHHPDRPGGDPITFVVWHSLFGILVFLSLLPVCTRWAINEVSWIAQKHR